MHYATAGDIRSANHSLRATGDVRAANDAVRAAAHYSTIRSAANDGLPAARAHAAALLRAGTGPVPSAERSGQCKPAAASASGQRRRQRRRRAQRSPVGRTRCRHSSLEQYCSLIAAAPLQTGRSGRDGRPAWPAPVASIVRARASSRTAAAPSKASRRRRVSASDDPRLVRLPRMNHPRGRTV